MLFVVRVIGAWLSMGTSALTCCSFRVLMSLFITKPQESLTGTCLCYSIWIFPGLPSRWSTRTQTNSHSHPGSSFTRCELEDWAIPCNSFAGGILAPMCLCSLVCMMNSSINVRECQINGTWVVKLMRVCFLGPLLRFKLGHERSKHPCFVSLYSSYFISALTLQNFNWESIWILDNLKARSVCPTASVAQSIHMCAWWMRYYGEESNIGLSCFRWAPSSDKVLSGRYDTWSNFGAHTWFSRYGHYFLSSMHVTCPNERLMATCLIWSSSAAQTGQGVLRGWVRGAVQVASSQRVWGMCKYWGFSPWLVLKRDLWNGRQQCVCYFSLPFTTGTPSILTVHIIQSYVRLHSALVLFLCLTHKADS